MKKIILLAAIALLFIGCAGTGYSSNYRTHRTDKCEFYTGNAKLVCLQNEIDRLERKNSQKCPYADIAYYQWIVEGDPTGFYNCQQYKMYNN